MVKIIWNSVQFCNTAKDCQFPQDLGPRFFELYKASSVNQAHAKTGLSNFPVSYGSLRLHLNFCWAFEAFLRSSESSTRLKEEPNVCPDLLSKAKICSFYASPEGTVVLELIKRPILGLNNPIELFSCTLATSYPDTFPPSPQQITDIVRNPNYSNLICMRHLLQVSWALLWVSGSLA